MEQNSVIVQYSVIYGPVISGVRRTEATFGRAMTVTGLAPYTNYSIEVSAVNSDGAMGPYTSPLFVAMLHHDISMSVLAGSLVAEFAGFLVIMVIFVVAMVIYMRRRGLCHLQTSTHHSDAFNMSSKDIQPENR